MQTMHKKIGILVLLGLLSIVASSASAQNFLVQFDEYGNGNANGNPLFSTIALDTQSGLLTLMYQLPFFVIPGDLFLTETNVTPPILSDLVRFDNNSTGGVVYFFSDPADPNEIPIPLADVGVPQPNAANNTIILVEQGIEGGINGLFNYTPALGTPGSAPAGVVPMTYDIFSDGQVPEPSTLVMLGMSAIGLLVYAWRKRK